MAGIPFSITLTGVALSSGSYPYTRTLAQIIAAANVRARIKRVQLDLYAGASGSDPAVVEMVRQSTSGTSSSGTLVKVNETDAETLQTTAKITFTSTEPTYSSTLDSQRASVSGGRAVFQYQDHYVKGGSIEGVRVTIPVACTADIHIEGEE